MINLPIQITDDRLKALALEPKYPHPKSTTIELRACIDETLVLKPGFCTKISFGFRAELPEALAALITSEKLQVKTNQIIEPHYAQVWGCVFLNETDVSISIEPFDVVAKAMLLPAIQVEIVPVDSLDTGPIADWVNQS